jgi:hypothetical protein
MAFWLSPAHPRRQAQHAGSLDLFNNHCLGMLENRHIHREPSLENKILQERSSLFTQGEILEGGVAQADKLETPSGCTEGATHHYLSLSSHPFGQQ